MRDHSFLIVSWEWMRENALHRGLRRALRHRSRNCSRKTSRISILESPTSRLAEVRRMTQPFTSYSTTKTIRGSRWQTAQQHLICGIQCILMNATNRRQNLNTIHTKGPRDKVHCAAMGLHLRILRQGKWLLFMSSSYSFLFHSFL